LPSLIAKADFVGIEQVAHLAAGGEAPVLTSHLGAAARFLVDKGIGMPGRERMFAAVARTRERLGQLMGVSGEAISFLLNATAGLRLAANGIAWRPGDNAVVAKSEFPSLLTIWERLGEGPVEVRRVGQSETPTGKEFAEAVDERTRMIAVSHVSYLTGARQDLAALREIADRVGARLVVDASHSLGVVQIPGTLCDALVSCSYKWLMGTHGIGVFFVNPERWPELAPTEIGWHSILPENDWRRRDNYRLKQGAERFEAGNIAFLSAYLLDNAAGVLQSIGMAQTEAHALELGGELRSRLARLGLPLLTPASPKARAGNICFATERSEEIEAALRAVGVLTWAGDGRLRLSVHAYNDEQDIHRAVEGLSQILRH